MRVNCFSNIHSICSHFNSKTYLANQVTCMRADYASTNNAMCFGVKDELCKSFITAIGNCTTASSPWK